jgi:MFS family permease
MLVSSRFVQGLGEALAAPASLGLLVVLFPDPRERTKALGIWGGLAGLGGTTGAAGGKPCARYPQERSASWTTATQTAST